MKELENSLNYTFKNKKLLSRALSHSSYANENRHSDGSNERLEFLGDSVLSIIVAEHLFLNYRDRAEGELTKLRAALVCENALYEFALELNLGAFLMLGKGEMQNHGNERPSILSDAFEAVLAAIYLDGGIEHAKKLVLRFIDKKLADLTAVAFKDYKTVLQEVIQKNPEERLEYVLVDESGPDHAKVFTVEIHLNSNVIGKGTAGSKKRAEQEAAKVALELMGQTL